MSGTKGKAWYLIGNHNTEAMSQSVLDTKTHKVKEEPMDANADEGSQGTYKIKKEDPDPDDPVDLEEESQKIKTHKTKKVKIKEEASDSLKCPICKMSKKKVSLDHHMERCKAIACHLCGRICSTPGRLEQHLKSHLENPNGVACEFCGKVIKTTVKSNVSQRMWRHKQACEKRVPPKKYYCKGCSAEFTNKEKMERHENKCVTPECEKCGRTFKNNHAKGQHKCWILTEDPLTGL